MKKLQQLLTMEKIKLQRLLEIMKLGSHAHHQKPVDYPEAVLKKLSSVDAKMSGLETRPKQMSDLASTLKTVSSDVELLHKEIKRLREENCSLREKNSSLEEKISSIDSDFNDLEQYGRRQNLNGIHMSGDESIAEVESKVLTVLKKIYENISHQGIDAVHRLGKSKKQNPQHHCQIYL